MGPSVRKLSPIFRGKNGFEVHERRPRSFRTVKICSSVARKYDFPQLVTHDYELVL